MKRKIFYSQEAQRDLDDIWDYIASDLLSVTAAEHTVGRIMDAAQQLELFPEMGTLLSAVTANCSNHRYLVAGNYMIFYRISETGVYVDRILYGRRDYLHILFGDMPQ